jgi:hypothetical protein
MRCLIVLLAIAGSLTAEDAEAIVRRSVSKDLVNWNLRKDYTYTARSEERDLDKNGKVKKTDSETVEVSILYGEPYFRVIEKNDKPLLANDARKEQERLAKFADKRKNDTQQQQEQRLADFQKKRAKEREFLREVPAAYNLRLLGEELLDGRETYVIDAQPRPGYRPNGDMSKYFPKIRAKIWIDKTGYQWVKVEAETTDTISIGLVLFRLYKGARLEFEQERINGEIWMPKRIHIEAAGRMGLLLREGYQQDTVFDKYRKFQTDSRIVSAAEAK